LKSAVVLLDNGFEDIEALTPVDILRRGDVNCIIASVDDSLYKSSSRNTTIKTDDTLKNIDPDKYEALILPGGIPGATNLRDNENVIDLVKKFYSKGKIVAAICAAPIVLKKAGIIDGKKVTSNPGFKDELGKVDYKEDLVVQDGNIITSRGAATSIYFAFKILENITDESTVKRVEKSTVMNLVKEYYGK
jgi:protein deglycase